MSEDAEHTIQLSPLAQRALEQARERFQEQMNEILQMDADAQEIDTDEYGWHPQIGAWVKQEEADE